MSAKPEVTLKTNSYEIKLTVILLLPFDLYPTINNGYIQI